MPRPTGEVHRANEPLAAGGKRPLLPEHLPESKGGAGADGDVGVSGQHASRHADAASDGDSGRRAAPQMVAPLAKQTHGGVAAVVAVADQCGGGDEPALH